jgi:acetylornithine deacetylase/succinyl-diaminopimelate desuccinylase-like protein
MRTARHEDCAAQLAAPERLECCAKRSGPDTEPRQFPAYDQGMTESELRAAVAAVLPGVRADLERLVAIPSIAFDGFDHSHVQASAVATAALLRGAGLPDVKIVQSGGQPAVIGRRPAPAGAPTVLLYAHHDVQPIGDATAWETEPFVATERDGRLYGRGAADDKAGIMAHVAALRAFGDDLPVGVVLFIEGEEEFGSDSLERLLAENHDDLRADVIVIADSGNWDVGVPALTTSLRGILNFFVDVRTLDHAVHSGMYGGAIPDALMALTRLLATLHDDAGDVAIDGLVRNEAAPLDYPTDRFRAEAGILDGVELIGTGRIVDRIWTKPSLSILGIDAPPTNAAPNALVPAARAKLSVRIAPGDDPKKAYEAVKAHIEARVPWGAVVDVRIEHDGNACVIDATGPYFDAARAAFRQAWDGTEPVDIGVGGSIPFIATFQDMFPDASILVTGVEDPHARAHGPNESLHLGEFARVCLAEALLLQNVSEVKR